MERAGDADVLLQTRRLYGVGVEAAVERVGELREAVGARDAYVLPGGAALGAELREFGPALNHVGGEALALAAGGGERREVGGRDVARGAVADEHAQRVGRHRLVGARLLELVLPLVGLQLRAREVDGRDLAAAQEERRDVLELLGRRQILLRGAALRGRERQPVVGLGGRLLERSAGDLRAGARGVEQGVGARERRAQAARNVYVARDAQERLVLADGVVGDEALRANRRADGGRGVDVVERRAHLRQEGRARLAHVLGGDALVQLRLLQGGDLRRGETENLFERERPRSLTRGLIGLLARGGRRRRL